MELNINIDNDGFFIISELRNGVYKYLSFKDVKLMLLDIRKHIQHLKIQVIYFMPLISDEITMKRRLY